MSVLTAQSRNLLSRILWVASLLLFGWMIVELFRPDWNGTGNPKWLIMIAGILLSLAASYLRPRDQVS